MKNEEIISGVKENNPSAFKELEILVRKYYRKQTHHARINEENVVITALEKLEYNLKNNKLHSAEALRKYIWTIVSGCAIDEWRIIEHYSSLSPDIEIDSENNYPTEEIDPVQKTVLHRALLLLDPKCKEILTLRYWKDYKHSEIAESLQISLENAKTISSRCTQKLKELFNKLSLTPFRF